MSCNYVPSDEDYELAKAQEESLRYYEEIEVPRRLSAAPDAEGGNKSEITSTQIEKKYGSVLYNGSEAEGFHVAAGSSYIYPTNYPLRQYQATMVTTALFKNTLVSLPTGLGKTFIAAVVMYNFYRWYPCGKVVFMAPTRPLVAQQIKACHDIMNIPVADTVEMTGNLNANQRVALWKEKRVFFLTPQVMVNDLATNACPSTFIKCLVVDEAHRAVKDYAYCQVVRQLLDGGVVFRILALSATPGNDANAVQQVIKNLNIGALELRGEDALDVAPYTHSRSIQNIVVELSPNIQRVKQDFLQVYEKYARKLKDYKAFNSNIATTSKFQIMKACEKFRTNPPRNLPPSLKGSLICNFTVCMSLAHALDLLQTYGLRAFFRYLSDENSENKNKAASTRIRNDEDLKKILDRLRQMLLSKPGSGNYIWGHPKYQKLLSIVSSHFTNYEEAGESTKAIIFCEYRVVVNEIVELLESAGSHVRPVMFVGQSGGKDKGMPQAKQLQIMKEFRSGEVNCLVSTCVGEEGLDVGDVDLIVLIETHKSLTRLVQRIGRTGRKRKGRCVVLLTRGKEEHKFQEAMASRKSYVTDILSSSSIKASLCKDNPRMLPPDVNPKRELVHIKPDVIMTPVKNLPKKQTDIRESLVPEESPFINAEQYSKILMELGNSKLTLNQLPIHHSSYLWHRKQDKAMSVEELLRKDFNLMSDWIDWNREERPYFEIAHSSETNLLCRLLDNNRGKSDMFPEEGLSSALDYLKNLENDSEQAVSHDKRKYSNRSVSSESENSEKELPIKIPKSKNKRFKHEKINKNMDIRQCWGNAPEKFKCDFDFSPDVIHVETLNIKESSLDVISNMEAILERLNLIFDNDTQSYLSKSADFGYDFASKLELSDVEKFLLPKTVKNTLLSEIPPLPLIEAVCTDFDDEMLSNLKTDSILKENGLSIFFMVEKKDVGGYAIPKFQEINRGKTGNNGSISSNSSVDLVGIDELFAETGVVHNEYDDRYLNSPGIDWVNESARSDKLQINIGKTSLLPGNKQVEAHHGYMTPSKKLRQQECLEPQDFLEFETSFHTPGNNIGDKNVNEKKIHLSATPSKKSHVHSPVFNKIIGNIKDSPISKYWEETPEGLHKLSCMNSCFSPVKHNLASSTPLRKQSEKNVKNNEAKCDQEVEESDEDVWNLSDLFSSEDSSDAKPQVATQPNNSSMLGVTQLLSIIEKNKNVQNCNQKTNSPTVKYETIEKLNNIDDSPISGSAPIQSSKPLNENNADDIGLLDIDSDVFADIDDILDSNDNSSEMERKVKMEENASRSSVECLNNVEAVTNPKDESSIVLTQNINFKKFNSNKKLFVNEKEIGGPRSHFLTSQEHKNALPPVAIEHKKMTEEGLYSVEKARIQRQSKQVTEASYFDFEFSESQHLSSDLSNRFKTEPDKLKIKEIKNCASTTSSKLSPKYLSGNSYLSQESYLQSKSVMKTEPEDDDIFQEPSPVNFKSKRLTRRPNIKNKSPKRVSRAYIEKEADVSGVDTSDDEDGSDLDGFDESFIDDRSMAVDIHANYLQSIKSPAAGKFKLPQNKNYPTDIFSQTVHQDKDYLHDSFCVSSDEETFEAEPSLLEIAERKLINSKKNKRKPKKQFKRVKCVDSSSSPIVISSDDSSGDDVYQLQHSSKRKTTVSSSPELESSPSQIRRNNKLKRIKTLKTSSDESENEEFSFKCERSTQKSCESKQKLNSGISLTSATNIEESRKSKLSLKGVKKPDRKKSCDILIRSDSDENEDSDLKKAIYLSQLEFMASQDGNSRPSRQLPKISGIPKTSSNERTLMDDSLKKQKELSKKYTGYIINSLDFDSD